MRIQRDNCKGIFHSQSLHCPVTKDQWDCFQNDLEERGGKELFPNYQNITDIFVSILLLQPNKLSIDHQTNYVFVNDDLEGRIWFCKIQLLHLLLASAFTDSAFFKHSSLLSFLSQEMSLNIDINRILPVKVSGVCPKLLSRSLILSQRCNVVIPGKMFHSNSVDSPLIAS